MHNNPLPFFKRKEINTLTNLENKRLKYISSLINNKTNFAFLSGKKLKGHYKYILCKKEISLPNFKNGSKRSR